MGLWLIVITYIQKPQSDTLESEHYKFLFVSIMKISEIFKNVYNKIIILLSFNKMIDNFLDLSYWYNIFIVIYILKSIIRIRCLVQLQIMYYF